MPLTEAQYKTYIYNRTGQAIDPDDLDLIWTRFDSISSLELRYNYALIETIEFLLGTSWQSFNFSTAAGESYSAQQRFQNLVELAKRASADIARIEGITRAGSIRVSRMTTKSPIPSPVGWPDASSPVYGGVAQPGAVTGTATE